jgi:hypothetical protein
MGSLSIASKTQGKKAQAKDQPGPSDHAREKNEVV